MMIQDERITRLNEHEATGGDYVLYWMQQAQRVHFNHALEYAVRRANEEGLPVLAVFGITQRFPEASERHYAFMLEGLLETVGALAERGIRLTVRRSPPVEAVLELVDRAAMVVTDRGYLRIQRNWRRRVADRAGCPVIQVESDVVVPVEAVSDKEEYAARTLRPRIEEHLQCFLVPLEATAVERDSLDLAPDRLSLDDLGALLAELRLSREPDRTEHFVGGYTEARRLLDEFLDDRLESYADQSRDPGRDCLSHMSPYLHFGQISPIEIALAVRDASGVSQENRDAYLEELIVRRELAMNLCHYSECYDSFDVLPDWARETLTEHADDARNPAYDPATLEAAETHDDYWNAAQRELVITGKMHGYMRMYWGKKILEWTAGPEDAFDIAAYLNNKYSLDGRDPNSFAGVAWCFGKHDQAWGERPIYGKVRYMSASGLERKFDMESYLKRVNELSAEG